jgi:hypothetical protein
MSTKTAKPKAVSSKGTTSKNGRSANGTSLKTAKPKKSMYQRWIEKYGVDDSESGKATLELWHIVYDSHNKPKP